MNYVASVCICNNVKCKLPFPGGHSVLSPTSYAVNMQKVISIKVHEFINLEIRSPNVLVCGTYISDEGLI